MASREVHRNKDDRRRMRLTKEKVQHVERAIRYADYGDGYARLERQCQHQHQHIQICQTAAWLPDSIVHCVTLVAELDLYDAGAKLVADLIVER